MIGSGYARESTRDIEGNYDHLPPGELHNLRRRRAYAQIHFKAALETPLSTTDAVNLRRNREMADAMGAPENFPVSRDTRRRVGELHLALPVEREAAKGHA